MRISAVSNYVLALGLVSSTALAGDLDALTKLSDLEVSSELKEGDHDEEGDHDHDEEGDHDHDEEGDHDHDEEGDHDHGSADFDFDSYSLVLAGKDLANDACYSGLSFSEADGVEAITAESSFSHDGEGAGTLVLRLSESGTQFTGSNERGMIVINLSEGAGSIEEAMNYAVSWEHEGHQDRGFCQELEIYEHDEDHDEEDHDHDHDHGEVEFDPSQYQFVLSGTDLEGQSCFLGINSKLQDGVETVFVESSFSHEGEGAGVLQLSLSTEGNQLFGTSERGRIVINLSEDNTDVKEALSYVVSWEHEGHEDRGFCQDLSIL